MPDLGRSLRALPLALLLACRGSDGAPKQPPVDPEYRADVETLCNVLERSGAAYQDPAERQYSISTYLAEHIYTEGGRELMIGFKEQPEPGDALRAEAKRVGLAGCPLADSWQ